MGGFDMEEWVKKFVDDFKFFIILMSYDMFIVVMMINCVIYDQLIKKEIVFVEDILIFIFEVVSLQLIDMIEKWYECNDKIYYSCFFVVDQYMKVYGMVILKDVIGYDFFILIEKVMMKNLMMVYGKILVVFFVYMMVWEGIEVLFVVDDYYWLEGIISC